MNAKGDGRSAAANSNLYSDGERDAKRALDEVYCHELSMASGLRVPLVSLGGDLKRTKTSRTPQSITESDKSFHSLILQQQELMRQYYSSHDSTSFTAVPSICPPPPTHLCVPMARKSYHNGSGDEDPKFSAFKASNIVKQLKPSAPTKVSNRAEERKSEALTLEHSSDYHQESTLMPSSSDSLCQGRHSEILSASETHDTGSYRNSALNATAKARREVASLSSTTSAHDDPPSSPGSDYNDEKLYIPRVEPGVTGTTSITPNDVLSGRGGGINQHEGNCYFRSLIDKNRAQYLQARKSDKPIISMSIVAAIRERNGRFLKKEDSDGSESGKGLWFEIGDDAAREKASQALRQRAPVYRKQLYKEWLQVRDEKSASNNQLVSRLPSEEKSPMPLMFDDKNSRQPVTAAVLPPLLQYYGTNTAMIQNPMNATTISSFPLSNHPTFTSNDYSMTAMGRRDDISSILLDSLNSTRSSGGGPLTMIELSEQLLFQQQQQQQQERINLKRKLETLNVIEKAILGMSPGGM